MLAVLSKARTLAADGIHQVHFVRGGNSSGFAGNSRKETNCSNLSTSCLNFFWDNLRLEVLVVQIFLLLGSSHTKVIRIGG